jgi:hypothetical protein
MQYFDLPLQSNWCRSPAKGLYASHVALWANLIVASRVSNFIQTPASQRAHPPRIMEGAMHDSQRYRDSAAECLLAAEKACQPYYRRLHLATAASWLSLARQDEAIDNLFASWDTDKPIREPAIGRH